jgi:hypothetical protein
LSMLRILECADTSALSKRRSRNGGTALQSFGVDSQTLSELTARFAQRK